MKNIIDIYESILDDIETNFENTKEYNEIAHTFNWIAGSWLIKDFRDLKGGTRYNIERLIGKKHKNNTHYIGAVLDVMTENKKLFKKEHSFRTHIYSWLAAIIYETQFKKIIDEVGDWEICKKINEDVTNKLNDLLLDKNSEEKFYVESYPLLNHFKVNICIIKPHNNNPKYTAKYKLCGFTFPISEYRTKDK